MGRVPVLLHLLLLLRNPGLPLLLLQGAVGRLNKLNIGAGTPGYSPGILGYFPGTRATPLLVLAKPSLPPSGLSGKHLNIGKIFGTSSRIYRPSRKIYREKLIFSPQI